MRHVLLALSLLAVGCGSPCKGQYTQTDANGNLQKFNEHTQDGVQGCVTDNVPLTQWESSLQARVNAHVVCPAQPASRSLVAASNFYSYRDGKVYLDLNAATGEYRKLTLAEGKDSKQVFTRLQGCYYMRAGQLLLDTVNAASSQAFDPMEIFTYTTSSHALQMTRYDDSSDWDYKECPTLDTPDNFCADLRNGNEMYFPILTASQQSALLTEALLIRKQFNYSDVSSSTFEGLWANPTGTEKVREDYKYAVAAIVDTPQYIDQAWASYVRGTSNTMPDITSSTMPPLCYQGKQSVTLADGSSGSIYGEVCYVNGSYSFTQ